MSLIDEAMTACTRLLWTDVPDGCGGQDGSWTEGEEFTAAIVRDYAQERLAALSAEPGTRYTVLTKRSVDLKYHDVFRREADGCCFRVTAPGDQSTPGSAGLDLRQATAELYDLPDSEEVADDG